MQNDNQDVDIGEQVSQSQDLDFNVNIQPDERQQQQASSAQDIQPAAQIAQYESQQSPDSQKTQCLIQLWHIIFKSAAFAAYLLLSLFLSSEVFVFVVVVLLDAMDFWVVKNVTGRKLVGLRWWSKQKEDGTEEWFYETMNPNFQPNDCNSSVFWFSQTLATLLWGVLAFIRILTLSPFWFILCAIGAVLTGLNFVGYYKCRGEHQKKAKQYMTKLGLRALSSAF